MSIAAAPKQPGENRRGEGPVSTGVGVGRQHSRGGVGPPHTLAQAKQSELQEMKEAGEFGGQKWRERAKGR